MFIFLNYIFVYRKVLTSNNNNILIYIAGWNRRLYQTKFIDIYLTKTNSRNRLFSRMAINKMEIMSVNLVFLIFLKINFILLLIFISSIFYI